MILAAIAGNMLEWYDFTVYGLFAAYIAKAFFPAGTETASILLALASFGAGFVLRPIGAVVLGQYADRAGRRAALSLIIVLMSAGTATIAFTPSFARIGLAAPILIVIARLVQGFSVGGEMGGATAFLIESAPPERRGFYASWQFAGQAAASLAGSLIAALLTRSVSPEGLAGWAWRIPFIAGLAIGPLGLYLRSKMDEPAEFKAAQRSPASPALAILRGYKKQVARSFGATILGTASVYLVFFYTPTYAMRELGATPSRAFIAATCASLLWLGFNPIAGRVSDMIGRRRQMLIAAVAMGVLVYPLYSALVAHPALGVLIAVQGALAVLVAMFIAPLAALIGEMFPANLRATGLSLGYSVAVPLFGGFAPYLVARFQTGDHLAPAYYMMVCAALTSVSLALSPPAAASRPS